MKRFAAPIAIAAGLALSLVAQVNFDRTDTFTRVKERLGAAYVSATNTVDMASISDGAVGATNITVTGAAIGNYALASLSTVGTNNVFITANVSAANTVRVLFFNKNGAGLDLASGTLRVTVLK